MYEYCSNLKSIPLVNHYGLDTFHATNVDFMFRGCDKLETIYGSMIDFTNVTSGRYVFWGCTNLQYVNFTHNCIGFDIDFSRSPNLSDRGIQKIIDALKRLTVSNKRTLTLHSTVAAKLTQAQLDTIKSKNWVVG